MNHNTLDRRKHGHVNSMLARFAAVFADSLPTNVLSDLLAHLLRAAMVPRSPDYMQQVAIALGQVYSAPAFVEPTLRFFNFVVMQVDAEKLKTAIDTIAANPLRSFALRFLVPAYCSQALNGRQFAAAATGAVKLAERLLDIAAFHEISVDLPHMLLPLLDTLKPADSGVAPDPIVCASILDLLTSLVRKHGHELTSMQAAIRICEPIPAVSITQGPLRTGALLNAEVRWAAAGKLFGAALLDGTGALCSAYGVYDVSEHKLLRYSCPPLRLDADSADYMRSQLLGGLGYAQQFPAYQHAFVPFQLRVIQEIGGQSARPHVPSYMVGADPALWIPLATLRLARELDKLEVGKELLRSVPPRELMRPLHDGAARETACPSFMHAFRSVLDGHIAPEAINRELVALCGDAAMDIPAVKVWSLAELANTDGGTVAELLRVRINAHEPRFDPKVGAPQGVVLRISDVANSSIKAKLFADVDHSDARNNQVLQGFGQDGAVVLHSVVVRRNDRAAAILALEWRQTR